MIFARRAMVPALVGLSAVAGMLSLAHATRHGVGIAPDSVSYIEAARSLGAGHGISTLDEDGAEYRPMTRFPPLYPVAIATIARLGLDSIDAARWLNLALLGANIVLVSVLVASSAPGARWLPAVGAVLMASSPDVAMIHATALSEPLFLLLGFSGLLLLSLHLETPKRWKLLVASLLIALAFLTRYVGGALIATGIVAILLAPGLRLRQRIIDLAAFAAIATLPMAAWTLRNQLSGASATGRRFAFHLIGGDAITFGIQTIGRWFLAGVGGEVLAWLLAVGLFSSALIWLRSGTARAADSAMPRILLLFVTAYLIFLVVSISFFDAETPLNGRILSPVFVATLVVAVCGARAGIRSGRGSPPGILAALLALIFAFAYARDTQEWVHERAAAGGVGFGSLAWQRSETMRRVKELPADARVYSNGRDAIYILTGRATRWIPAPVDAETREPRPGYAPELEEIRAALRAESVSLVWFDLISWRWYLPSRSDLYPRLPIRRVSELRDGEIWGYDASRDTPSAP